MKIESATIRRLKDALLESGRRPSLVLSSAYAILAREGLLTVEESAALERVDPLAETMFLMMAADGVLHDAERDAIRGAIRGLANGLLRSGTIEVMLETYQKRLAEEGRDARLEEIAEQLRESPLEAEGAFTLAAAIALSDDQVSSEENAFINQVAEWFGITPERATVVLDLLEHDQDAG